MEPIRISYNTLSTAAPETLAAPLAQAFGSSPGCLGIVLIDDLPPDFPRLRENLLRLAHGFASLPPEAREDLARPETSYMFGWSHGKEIMNGRPDTQKGSYYANPVIDRPDVSEEIKTRHPEYYAGNVWPKGIKEMAEFEPSFKSLGKLIFEVGVLLAKACETFVAPNLPKGVTVESLIASSKCNKARLLHYFPESSTSSPADTANDALCGTHLDHSLLTGLCSAIYLESRPGSNSPPKQVPSPSATSGLYIYPRNQSTPIRVQIPADCLAFQTGEALSILTDGKLAATPHFVSGSASAPNVSRETFALFLQPDVDDVIGADGETFGAFTKRTLDEHYAHDQSGEAEA